MPPKSPTILYAGPTLTPEARTLIQKHGLDLQPPAKRGDIDALLDRGFHGTIVLVDGYFVQLLSIGHAEIRRAIEAGRPVYGLSSMGAIRAYEMETLGMTGFGKTFAWFKRERDFQDDEVSLLHGPAPEYLKISEPLVHFRECILDLVETKKLSAEAGARIVDELKSMYFGKRRFSLFEQLLKQHAGLALPDLKADFDRYRIKQQDLIDFLQQSVWENGPAGLIRPGPE